MNPSEITELIGMLRPNDALVFKQNKEGYSFVCNTEGVKIPVRIPVPGFGNATLKGCFSYQRDAGAILLEYAGNFGISADKLRVLIDAYADKPEEWARRLVAVFVRTDALEGILQRHPELREHQM